MEVPVPRSAQKPLLIRKLSTLVRRRYCGATRTSAFVRAIISSRVLELLVMLRHPLRSLGLSYALGAKSMKLLLRRNQRQGVLGKVAFTLEVRAQLSSEEQEAIRKYRLDDTVLYEKNTMT